MQKQSNFTRFNDGVALIYRDNAERTTFGAKTNTRGVEDMTFVVKLAFEELSKRQQDQEFAEQAGFSLSMKIRTRLVAGVDSKCKAVIGKTLYDISYLDKGRGELFLYLEEVRQLDS